MKISGGKESRGQGAGPALWGHDRSVYRGLRPWGMSSLGGPLPACARLGAYRSLLFYYFFYFIHFLIKLIGVTLLIQLYNFRVYIIIRHLYASVLMAEQDRVLKSGLEELADSSPVRSQGVRMCETPHPRPLPKHSSRPWFYFFASSGASPPRGVWSATRLSLDGALPLTTFFNLVSSSSQIFSIHIAGLLLLLVTFD